MNAGSFAYVVLRLGAIVVAYQALLQSPYIVSMIQAYFAGRDATFLLGVFGFLVLAGSSCMLWFGAKWISSKIVAPLKDSPEPETSPLTAETLLQVGLVLLGVYMLFQASFYLIAQLVSMTSMGIDFSGILTVIIRCAFFGAFGILCITSPSGFSKLLQKLRKAGSP
ncbi:hypothetical protein EOI86_15280 [Hwanghaeella grinnelliae]|uniref:Uncharacterized protein n=1 Tax=Hwanghaeella grinnelliae TaxID=2500179 RepID=A0A3S2Z959_9PROT|nr:hypothetical protein [Hwanghaeella grinnelliae]RVU36549.1 hypothetical protein EOI86_15280 [Hwanghaeella grinnelliae]